MRGSLREKRPGYWELRVSLGRDPVTGKPKYRTKGMRGSQREAERALARLITDVGKGQAARSADSVGSLLDQWLEHIESEGRSPTTLRGYRSMVDQLPPAFLRKPLSRITPKAVDELYRELGKKRGRNASTVHHFHRLLNAAFNQAMRWEMLDRNPAKLARPPRGRQKEIEPPNIAEVRKVIDAAVVSQNPENGLIFRLIAATGCRRAELCGLHWTDVALDQGIVTIRTSVVQVGADLYEKDTKAHQQRAVKLDATTASMLRAHHEAVTARAAEFETKLDKAAYVFSEEIDGSLPIPPDRLSQAWRRLADAIGSDSRLHDLRHLQASILLDAGESVTTVAARLGHRDTATTLRVYAHLMPGADARAAEIVGGFLGD
jgi:integrase